MISHHYPHPLPPLKSKNDLKSDDIDSVQMPPREEHMKPHHPHLITDTRLLFWRTHTSVHAFVYHHILLDFFEVVIFSWEHESELNRLYVSCQTIFSILQEASTIKLAKLQVTNMRDKMLKSAAAFIIGSLDAHQSKFDVVPEVVLRRRQGQNRHYLILCI
jgi:hypothetical protein